MPDKALRYAIPVLCLTFIAGTAWAQQPWTEIDERVEVPPLGAAADDVDDWDVYTADGIRIGEVEEVIGPDAATPTALVVDFEDRAGYGDRDEVIVPLDHFSLDGERLLIDADPQAVADMEI
ncbi:PRC-barrel domain-containing protein [Nitratireductor sp. GCM10026969]|uniref:PRC-barrel domain-containing protein n=1 Tax=Nitratireductor sp. GCM10026969 TaxID=3252645 RepID=UPI00361D0AA5